MAEIRLNGKRYDATLDTYTEVGKERFTVLGLDSEEAFTFYGAQEFAQALIDAQAEGGLQATSAERFRQEARAFARSALWCGATFIIGVASCFIGLTVR